jgi:alpha-glucosidase
MAGAVAQTVIDSTKALITSPDKNYVVVFYQKQNADGTRTMCYTLTFKQQPVISESVLDIQLDNNLSERAMALKVDKHAKWCENLQVKAIRYASKDTSWKPLYGERSVIKDNYNAVTIELVKDDNPIYPMNVELRVYNEGAAIRYFFPENIKGTYYRIVAENTSFSLPAGHRRLTHYAR